MSKEIWFRQGIKLTEIQKEELIAILTKYCRCKTYDRIKSLITYDLDTVIKNIGWMERFYICEHGHVKYCEGQSYPCEIRAIRKHIINKYP